MANTQSAKKQVRNSYRKWLRNRYIKGKMRGAVKVVREAIEAGDYETAQQWMPRASSELDKAARKHVIHPNKAARLKSRLMGQIHQLQQ
ncbi:MAG: 30S ribosomal protein S20 [Anaerolineae bacterium]|nr:30S ribosomal protein S20 [Anaerolineae bacterium]